MKYFRSLLLLLNCIYLASSLRLHQSTPLHANRLASIAKDDTLRISTDYLNVDEELGPQKSCPDYRSGFVSILGNPNVGKSSLLNALLGQKLSIVSPKPQTTRERLIGVLSEPNYQMIFCDTPGMLKPAYKLQETMQTAVRSAVQAEEADIYLLVVDVTKGLDGNNLEDEVILSRLQRTDMPVIVATNKIDVDSPVPITQYWKTLLPNAEIFPVSAIRGDGISALREHLAQRLPLGPKYFPSDHISDRPERFFAAEIIREALFHLLHDEIPYGCYVMVESFKEASRTEIEARIIVNRRSHKAIVIGAQGKMIQSIAQRSKRGLEEFLGGPVALALQVVVNENWKDNPVALQRLGLLATDANKLGNRSRPPPTRSLHP